jgi:hypothetical protein
MGINSTRDTYNLATEHNNLRQHPRNQPDKGITKDNYIITSNPNHKLEWALILTPGTPGLVVGLEMGVNHNIYQI